MKKLPYTPNSQIRSAMRRLYMRSRERAAALKREGYCCERCHAKQSKAKGREVTVEVHHRAGEIDWERLIESIRIDLLPDPEDLECLCIACHDKIHKG